MIYLDRVFALLWSHQWKVNEKSRLSADWLKFAVQGFAHLLKKTSKANFCKWKKDGWPLHWWFLVSPASLPREFHSAKRRGVCIHRGARNKDTRNCGERSSEQMLFYNKFQMHNTATYSRFFFWRNAMPSNSLKTRSVNNQLQLVFSSILGKGWKTK